MTVDEPSENHLILHKPLPPTQSQSAPNTATFPPPPHSDGTPHTASLPGVTVTSVLKRWCSKNSSVTVSKTWVRRGASEDLEGKDEAVRMEEGNGGTRERPEVSRGRASRPSSLYASQDHVLQYQQFIDSQRTPLPGISEQA